MNIVEGAYKKTALSFSVKPFHQHVLHVAHDSNCTESGIGGRSADVGDMWLLNLC